MTFFTVYVDCGELEDKKAIIEYEYTVGYAEAKFQCKRPLQGQIGKETFYCLMSGKWGGPNVQCGRKNFKWSLKYFNQMIKHKILLET